MAGIREVAERAGVSISTVSNVLHHKNSASEETKERIFAAAEELGYEIPSGKQPANRTILFDFSDFDMLYYMDILHGISDYVYARDYSLLISTGRNFLQYADPEQVCGCIVIDLYTPDSSLRKISEKGVPIIVLDREVAIPRVKSIVVNNYAAERRLIEGLYEGGARRFAFLDGLDSEDNRERFRAFRDVLRERELPFRRNDRFEGDWREKSGTQAARLLMLSEEMPEVLVAANDMMAIGAIRKFRENGLRVPEDIAVCGYDDIIISKYLGLTTVSIPDYERGYLAAQSLIDILEGEGDYETVRLGAQVKWRKSTGSFVEKS